MKANFNEKSQKPNRFSKVVSPTKSNGNITQGMVKQMIKSSIKSIPNENKFFATSQTGTAVNFSGSTYPLTDVPQGLTDSQRTGDNITLDKLEINVGIYAATQANMVRCFVYQWLPSLTAGSPPAASAVLFSTGSALAPFSVNTVDQKPQYSVLYDEVVAVSASEPNRVLRIRLNKFKSRSVQYTGGTTNGCNKLFIVFISDDGVTPYPTVTFMSKLVYHDA